MTSESKKCKVLYLTGMYPVPAFPQQGIFCHEQVKALMAAGVDVTVAVPIPFYSKQRETIWCYEGVPIRYVRYFKYPGGYRFDKTGKWLYNALRRSGIDFTSFDVIHADAPLPSGYAAKLLSEKYQMPYVVHCHGLDVFLNADYGDKSCYLRILQSVDAVYNSAAAIVGVSQKTLENVIDRLDVADKCYVSYNGVDTNRFIPGTRKPDMQILKIVSIGNLIDLKGHDISIRAVSALIKEHNIQVQLDIFGRGEKKQALLELACELGISNHICFKGYVQYDNIAEELRKYDVFLLPSWYEAIGCVYLEAMASGVLTIGCWENGIDEVIVHGENGFLVRPHSVEDVVDVLKNIACKRGSDELFLIAERGRRAVEEGFTWKKSAESLSQVYKSVT